MPETQCSSGQASVRFVLRVFGGAAVMVAAGECPQVMQGLLEIVRFHPCGKIARPAPDIHLVQLPVVTAEGFAQDR